MTAKSKVKRGRPQLDRETVQEKLLMRGWRIPDAVKYKGANELHTLECIHCGYITEKWLSNVIYRGETCPNAGNHDIVDKPVLVGESTVKIDYDRIADTVAKAIRDELSGVQELILGTAINRDDLIKKFGDLYGKTVSRKGYLVYNRKMTTEEWFDTSDNIARQLIARLDPEKETLLLKNFNYHRDKNPHTKPETVLLQIMSKTMLYKALEQVQLIKVLL